MRQDTASEPAEEDLAPLVAKAKDGDRDALDRVCDRCYDHVLGYFRREIPSDAEDLTQQLFADLERKLVGYTESGRFRAWLRGVAYHLVLTKRRSIMRRAETTFGTGMDFANSTTTSILKTAKGRLRRSVGELSQAEREAWELFARGCSHAEIARELGISASASAARVSRARSHLLETLRTAFEEEV